MSDRLQIDEHIRADSQVVRTYLVGAGDGVRIELEGPADGPRAGMLSAAAVVHVVRRYAKPLDAEVASQLEGAPRLALPGGLALARLHWRAAVDADARDWLVLLAPGEEPQAALATGVAAALRYLIARLADERGTP
jgi:hypothetical protein